MVNAYHTGSSDPDLALIAVLIRGEASQAGKDLPVAQSAEGQLDEIALAERLDKLEAYRTSDLRGREQLEGRRRDASAARPSGCGPFASYHHHGRDFSPFWDQPPPSTLLFR